MTRALSIREQGVTEEAGRLRLTEVHRSGSLRSRGCQPLCGFRGEDGEGSKDGKGGKDYGGHEPVKWRTVNPLSTLGVALGEGGSTVFESSVRIPILGDRRPATHVLSWTPGWLVPLEQGLFDMHDARFNARTRFTGPAHLPAWRPVWLPQDS